MSDIDNLKKLRLPFADNQISKLPKPTKKQNECPDSEKVNCKLCGGWHHPRVIHLDYVGHAALTDRLLDVDPLWNWDFVSVDANGLPVIDKDGGMWIRLTVCGVTRYGYGDAQDKTGGNAMKERIGAAQGKTGGNAMKERIGDALRNAAMRFGAALDLWHKGDLHVDEVEPITTKANGTDNAVALLEASGQSFCELWDTLDKAGKAGLWQTFSNDQKTKVKSLLGYEQTES